MTYFTPLRYFFVMTVMLLATGLWMFVLHTSLSIDGTLAYYAPKTFFGLLETVSPHLFGMGIFVFIVTHFFAIIQLPITQDIKQNTYRWLSLGLFFLMLLTNVSGFFIVEQSGFFAFLKLVSTLGFIVYSLWAMFKVYKLFKIT